MTELDIIKHAQGYLRKLSQGVDPITDNAVGEDSVLSQERLKKCFAYVDGILQKVVDGGIGRRRREPRAAFCVTEGMRDRIKVSDNPVSLSELIKNIQAADSSVGRLPFRQITGWLLSEGLLDEVPYDNGKMRRQATAKAEAKGIINATRSGQKGEYPVVLYRADAQRYIIQELDAIAAFSK